MLDVKRLTVCQITDPELPSVKKIHPVVASSASPSTVPSSQAKNAPLAPRSEDPSLKKRKRNDLDEADPKLQEFLEVMDPKHASKKLREDIGESGGVEMAPAPIEDESDGEYDELPAKGSKDVAKEAPVAPVVPVVADDESMLPPQTETTPQDVPAADVVKEAPQVPLTAATDDDWLRSRTNRLLDLVDPDDPSFATRSVLVGDAAPVQIPITTGPGSKEGQPVQDTTVDHPEEPAEPLDGDTAETLIQKTARLFVRNLPYTATEDSLRTRFGKFGIIEEVRKQRHCVPSFSLACQHDESMIGTSYTHSW